MKNEDLCDLIFRKTLLLEGELLNLLTKTPKIAPPLKRKEKEKKNPKHLKCSLTRAKDESHKRVDSSSLFLSVSLSLSVCPPLDNHEIYHKISLNFNIQQSWTLTKLKLKIKKRIILFFFYFLFFIYLFIFLFFFFFLLLPRTHGKQHAVRVSLAA